jgi:hypothetical protein
MFQKELLTTPMNSTTNSPTEVLRIKIKDAKDIAQSMLLDDVDADFAINYAKGIIKSWDSLDKIEALSHQIEAELKRIEADLSIAGHFELSEPEDNLGSNAAPQSSNRRPIIIPVTDGMLRQNLFTLTKAVKTKRMSVGQKITLILPDETQLTSTILAPGNRLQERSLIRKFYTENSVKAGDILQLHDVDADTWRVSIDRKSQSIDDFINK